MIGHDKHKPELPDTDAGDHAMDACIYGAMSRPWTPRRKDMREKSKDTWAEEEKPRSAWTW